MDQDWEKKFKVAEAIAEQICRQQQLTSFRMTWNLTFQGFLIAAFALSLSSGLPGFSSSPDATLKFGFQIIIGLAGGLVAWATMLSLYASRLQRDHGRELLDRLYSQLDQYSYPRPEASRRARYAAIIIPWTLISIWAGLVTLAALARANVV